MLLRHLQYRLNVAPWRPKCPGRRNRQHLGRRTRLSALRRTATATGNEVLARRSQKRRNSLLDDHVWRAYASRNSAIYEEVKNREPAYGFH